ncbi:helix-turn-helix domain-containing protein [Tropicimonas sp. TH_r6]|uniref:Crp/Fnr family transcriptional regulator n=1 Tax=Tropicimonas sp. TH_r6 TaxID=3082085 RepID=UPI0029541957|nr:helix-turn-helix domain-containing protein [Tropicimonas sp. TH_r6]MDV7143153.1 helix-turn-helix domain-containing protein [Tropicimonas sp. TH_r6]
MVPGPQRLGINAGWPCEWRCRSTGQHRSALRLSAHSKDSGQGHNAARPDRGVWKAGTKHERNKMMHPSTLGLEAVEPRHVRRTRDNANNVEILSSLATDGLAGMTAPRGESGWESPRRGGGRLRACFDTQGHERHYQPGSTILLHGEPARNMYLIESGTVRCCMIDADGSRQIFDFLSKGFFLGVTDVEVWHYTVEAVDHVTLRATSQQRIVDACCQDSALRDEFRAYACSVLERRERLMISLVHMNAQERLLAFLTDFARRRRSDGFVALPMQRHDIADYLGLSVETVSRTFSELKRKSLIDMATSEKFRLLASPGTSRMPVRPH